MDSCKQTQLISPVFEKKKITVDSPRLPRILCVFRSLPEVPRRAALSYQLSTPHDLGSFLSRHTEWSLHIYRVAECALSTAPLRATPRTSPSHYLLLLSTLFVFSMNHPPLPSTCPHTFYFPATGSRLDKKTCHWRPSLSE